MDFVGANMDSVNAEGWDRLADMVAERVIRTLIADRPVERAYLDRSQVAELLGVSVVTVDRMKRDGRLPFIGIGKRVKFAPDAVHAALRAQRQGNALN